MRLAGQLIGLFSYDVGYEIDLDRARELAAEGHPGELERRRAAPVSLAYATPPVRIPLGTQPARLGETTVEATASATVYDFGAVTIRLQIPLACDVASLPALTATLTGAGPLEDHARVLVDDLFRRLAPAITSPGRNEFVEDYYVVQVDRFEPATTVPELLATARGVLASELRCEAAPLSAADT